MSTSRARTATIAISGSLRREDLPSLFEHTCETLEHSGAELLLCDVTRVDADAVAVDALASLALVARRCGCRLLLRGADQRLCELVQFMGLVEVLRTAP